MAGFKKQFHFTETGDLYPFMLEILSEIEERTGETIFNRIRGSSRFILIELLTNAIKHTNGTISVICLEIDGSNVTISRSDSGQRFLVERPDHVIYSDDMATLYGKPLTDDKLVFNVVDHDLTRPPLVEHLSEHYGLTIITKASDEFTYAYDPAAGTNTFSARIKLG
ncbi:hypothetical protein [Hufsiella ginkgonis]|uniref:ATP-binding protein n=1 Tax=Hufsiella ginkgonis TaxID=2695274 RepID=A0A7K1XZ70_9SPHI|nr:hypothetical protein [Hufsiella ginkgonis]MXV16304.1 hypothetical protein [Hufsiella ginkgonis]